MTPSDADLFADALERPFAERESFVVTACGADVAQRGRILGLLLAHEKAAERLPAPLISRRPEVLSEAGAVIDRYKLLEKIGEGGCGVVWMAEQTVPVRRRVALKIIKLGMDTKEVIARFEAERQALALMAHPNIAKVFDAGATETGRPYFVMELVRGQPITRYCDERNLTAPQRLALFVQVCGAIHHAHAKGVVHRDIKPSNILVTNEDGAPLPKVIDFGIAKATQGRLTDRTLFTAFDQFIGTPAYMSPEQADYNVQEIDARSDVYSLGALLYELLSGRPPFDPKTLSLHGIEEVRRIIREVDPPRPSARHSTLTAAERTTLAQRFGTSSASHAGLLAGDLDWVAMKAIEKNRLRRYESAGAFAADIEHFLNHEPVSARPPATSYVLGKMLRRHRVAFAGATAVALALVAGTAVSTWQAIRATRAERAERHLRRENEVRAAEDARLSEERRRTAALLASRADLALASRLLEDGKTGDALAYFLRAAQEDPSNSLIAPRLLGTLASRSFLLPDHAPLPLPSRAGGIRLTSDGARLLFSCGDGRVRIVSLADWKIEREVRFSSAVVFGSGLALAAANPNLFAVECFDGRNSSIHVCNIATGEPIMPPVRRPSGVRPPTTSGSRISLSPDGRYLTSGDMKTAYVWDTIDGKLVQTLPFVTTNTLSAFPISAGNRYVVSVPSDKVIALHSPADGTELHRISLENGRRFRGCVLSPDGNKLVLSLLTHLNTNIPDGVRLYDLARKEWIGEEITLADVTRVRFSRDSRRCVLATSEGELLIVDAATGKPLARPPRHHARVNDVDFSADGQTLLTASIDGILRVWEVETGRLRMESTLPQERQTAAVLTPDARHVILFSSNPAAIYRLQVGRAASEPLILPRSNRTVAQAAFLAAPPARLLWMMSDRARIVDVASGAELGSFPYPEKLLPPTLAVQGLPESEIVGPGQRFVARTRDNRWHAWLLAETGISQNAVLQGTSARAWRATLSPDASLVAVTTGSRRIDVWNTTTGERIQRIEQAQPIGETAKSFSADNRVLAFDTRDSFGHLYELATGKDVLFGAAIRITLRPDGSRFYATSPDGGLVTVRDASGKLLRSTYPHRDHVLGFSRTPDGKYFASYSKAGSVEVCDGSTGEPVGPKLLHPQPVRFVRFSPDGTRLLVALTDGTGRVWDIRTGQPLTDVLRHGSDNNGGGGFSADGRFVMLRGATSGPARIWSLPPESGGQPVPAWLVKIAAACAGRRLNDKGEMVKAEDAFVDIAELRSELAALPDDAPYAAWGRWLLSDPDTQSIAPGFTITPAESRKLRAAYAAEAGVPADEPLPDDDPPDASEPPGGKG